MISPPREAIKGGGDGAPVETDKTMTSFRLAILLLAATAALGGCGRKNLPVARSGVRPAAAASVGAPGSRENNAPSTVANFQRANRITSEGDLTISPSEVSRNPKAANKRFPLDFLLN